MGHFRPPLKGDVFFEAAMAIAKIDLSLKSNNQIKLSMSKFPIHTVGYENVCICLIEIEWKFSGGVRGEHTTKLIPSF